MSEDRIDVTGGCYCGAVRYRARDVRAAVSECHCSQCRRQSGHRYATTTVATANLEVEGEDAITWFSATDQAARGFCSVCGSHLFWRPASDDHRAVLAASVDEPNGLRMWRHIYVADKGGYYEIDDGLPRFIDFDTPAE